MLYRSDVDPRSDVIIVCRSFASELRDLRDVIAGPQQIRAGGDNALTRRQPLDHQHVIAIQRSWTDRDGPDDGPPFTLVRRVGDVAIGDRIVDECIDGDARVATSALALVDVDGRDHAGTQL